MTTRDKRMQALTYAITKGGGIVAFCKKVGISPQAVNGGWRKRGYVPLNRAVAIEAATGVPHRDLVKPETLDALTAIDTLDVL